MTNQVWLFDGAFVCEQCGSTIELKIALAIVKSTGAEVTCKHCDARYLVTEEGAVPTSGYVSGKLNMRDNKYAWEE